jgi:hypothetical protein
MSVRGILRAVALGCVLYSASGGDVGTGGGACGAIEHCQAANVRCEAAADACIACESGFQFGASNSSCVEAPPKMVSTGLSVGMTFISFLAEFFYGLTSFGPAITFNIGWQILFVLGLSDGSLTSVTVNLMVMELFSASIQLAHLWKFYDVRFAIANVVPTLICTAVGTMLLILLDSVWLKRALAGLLVTLALQRVRARCRADAAALIPLHQPLQEQAAAASDAADPKLVASKLPIEQRYAFYPANSCRASPALPPGSLSCLPHTTSTSTKAKQNASIF